MKEVLTQSTLRRSVMYRLLESAVLIVMIVSCFIGYSRVRAARAAVAREQALIAARPEYLLQLAFVQTELRGRAHDIERILHLVLEPAEVVEFIASIEAAAARHRVTVAVPAIAEVPIFNAEQQPIEPTGPFRSIELTITARGAATDLLEYVHDLEHGSHLVTLPEWNISVGTAAAAGTPGSATRSAGEPAGETGGSKALVSAAPSSQLEASLILLVHNEKYSP